MEFVWGIHSYVSLSIPCAVHSIQDSNQLHAKNSDTEDATATIDKSFIRWDIISCNLSKTSLAIQQQIKQISFRFVFFRV